jgi:CheY-like chemotaxis protein
MANILVAEDEPDIRELVAFILRYAGHVVTTANHGEEAVRVAEQIIPDLVLMDVRMPRMTGYDACRAIKANPTIHIYRCISFSKGQEKRPGWFDGRG